MNAQTPLVISIARQIGCGGAYIGQLLAEKLNLRYADREILLEAAKKMSSLEEELIDIEEKRLSFWQSFLERSALIPGAYVPPQQTFAPRDRALFETQSHIIHDLALEGRVVIVGRAGFHVLHDIPGHVRIFLHSNPIHRIERFQKLYDVSHEKAEKMIRDIDKSRDAYCRTFTGQDRTDARNYDLSIDTSTLNLDKVMKIILDFIEIWTADK